MKQYTTPEQTAKLIELGFERPSSIASVEPIYGMGGISVAKAYSIGELFEFLPSCIKTLYDTAVLEISYDFENGEWYCGHRWRYNRGWKNQKTIGGAELIDTLYTYIIILKEEGVI